MKERIILVGETPNEDKLEQLRQQLVNLPAIRRANYHWRVNESGDSSLHWALEESQTLFPLINFGSIKNNLTYLVGFNDIHWRGRGQQLSAYYQNNDGEHNFSVALRNPSIQGGRWGYGFEVRRYAALEPIFFPEATLTYRYANLGTTARVSYSPSPREFIGLAINPFKEDYRKLAQPPGSPNVGPEAVELRKYALKADYQRNRINYLLEKRAGYLFAAYAQSVHTPNVENPFLILIGDVRWFSLIGRSGNLAGRVRAGVSSNENSPFAPFTVDSQINIRGSGNRIDRGTAQFVFNLEYRQTVWSDNQERFAAQLVGFSDFGTWRSPGGGLDDLVSGELFRHFIGGGLRLISNYAQDAVLRLDYGFDVRNPGNNGFVVGFGQYF